MTFYPRPQLERESYICLDGVWDFAVTEGESVPQSFSESINVPYPPQAKLSGIGRDVPDGSFLWYRREFPNQGIAPGERLLLNIGAADQTATVYVNGREAGSHSGGYEHFTLDITELANEFINEIVIRVHDSLKDRTQPYGKQSLKRGGMWYTPVSGIWQTVWMEKVPGTYVKSLDFTYGKDYVIVKAEGVKDGVIRLTELPDEGEFRLKDGAVYIAPKTMKLWSPEEPYLYRFELVSGEDRVKSYFAFRTLEIRDFEGIPRLCLNGEPFFFNGLLDQGYWMDGLMTPPSPETWAKEITELKKLGFNTLRKHIKVEPELFYYECDRLGMVVFQDMVNNGKYSFFKDTLLPTIGLTRLDDRRRHRDTNQRQAFAKAMTSTVNMLKNHPCICYWTIFNEGWGQFCSSEMYEHLRALDASRFIDSASGWFSGGKTDVSSVHIYFKKLRPPKKSERGRPYVISEFGGYVWKDEKHCFNLEKTYGYGIFKTKAEFQKAFKALYDEQVLPLIPKGLCAAIYTQVSDVEDETNGIFTYDREVNKLT